MSIYPDIDATCSSLGYHDGVKYYVHEDFLQCLKHLIWILRRDEETHDFRRYIGRKNVVKTDLLPMVLDCSEDSDTADVLLRLLVNLTNPVMLLYREELPKDNVGRRIFLELVEILQQYKEAFSADDVWALLGNRLQKALAVDLGERKEEHELLIERILVLARNVLQIPLNPTSERRLDNDANVHDQIIWALQQSGLLDIVLYILSSEFERQYHLHALEIIYLIYREQTAEILVDTSISATAAEKYRDEKMLVEARRQEKYQTVKMPAGRHSRFGGTYVVKNVKSLSDNPLICHQSLERLKELSFDVHKKKQKGLHRLMTKDEEVSTRRSVLAIRLFLREYCIEVLNSAFNLLVRYTRHALERSSGTGHDDTYLLWAIRFFMEFNRLKGFELQLVSEALSTNNIHWVVSRMHHHMDMMDSDKKKARLWGKRLHVALQTYKELILNILTLQKEPNERAQVLFETLQNSVCNMLEYRETALHLLLNFNERFSAKSYLKDVLELASIYFRFVEKFCQGHVVVPKNKKKSKDPRKEQEKLWASMVPAIVDALTAPVEAVEGAEGVFQPLEGDPDDHLAQIKTLLREKQIPDAVRLLRAARKSFPSSFDFGTNDASLEDEQDTLREIFVGEEESHDRPRALEINFSFADYEGRLLNPRVVSACTYLLEDWRTLTAKTLKATITILFRIAVNCKCPVMLFQARLLKIFQAALQAPLDDHNKELKRLAVYIVRHLTNVAKENQKVFAELLFLKTLREVEQVKNGYEGEVYKASKGSNKWTEEEEDELRVLFMRNQENPETDDDVIEWIANNLENKTRTRRQVLMKLKSLGLIFKAPTKKSTAAGRGKRFWQPEEDRRLRELYDQHRTDENIMDAIMPKLDLPKSRNAVIKRMIELGLIADKSEIKPSRRKAAAKNKKKQLNLEAGLNIAQKIIEEHREGFDWIIESLTEMLDDLEAGTAPDEGGVPLVPILEAQINAIGNKAFCKAMKDLGIHAPAAGESYWRIPADLSKEDVKKRIQVLKDALEGRTTAPSEASLSEPERHERSSSSSSSSDSDSDDGNSRGSMRKERWPEDGVARNRNSDTSSSSESESTRSSAVDNRWKESFKRAGSVTSPTKTSQSRSEQTRNSTAMDEDSNMSLLNTTSRTRKETLLVSSDDEGSQSAVKPSLHKRTQKVLSDDESSRSPMKAKSPPKSKSPPKRKSVAKSKKVAGSKLKAAENFGESAFTSSDSEAELESWNPMKGQLGLVDEPVAGKSSAKKAASKSSTKKAPQKSSATKAPAKKKPEAEKASAPKKRGQAKKTVAKKGARKRTVSQASSVSSGLVASDDESEQNGENLKEASEAPEEAPEEEEEVEKVKTPETKKRKRLIVDSDNSSDEDQAAKIDLQVEEEPLAGSEDESVNRKIKKKRMILDEDDDE